MTTAMTPGLLGGNTRGAAAQWGGRRVDSPNPWRALWAMMVGFFMILVDSTIVAVANPSIMAKLGTGYATVIWVTSAYLLAYAVPLLVAGRLGDRFGVKNLYLIGLAVFTGASLWCGLSGSIGMLITARVVQGVGAGLLTPQTLSLITRIFPPERRGVAMSVWGATAGIATLVGPLAGGVLVDGFGWEWIFFVNVPIGIAGLALAVWLVPVLPTHQHRFDPVAVGLSGAGMFLIVFALQEGQSAQWAPWIWAVLVAGIGLAVAFVYWQSINTREPLIPLKIFYSRDFTLSSLGVFVIGFATTAMVLPLMFYAQAVCGLSPTRSALLMAPMAIVSGLLAPVAGNIVDRYHPGPVIGLGFSLLAIALTWLSIEMAPGTPIWRLVLPFIVMGGGNAFIWSPLAATATRNLPAHLAGASSGVYNAARQVGAVLGSSGMAAFMTSRITAEMPRTGAGADSGSAEGTVLRLPGFLREPFSAAMSQSMLLPAFASLFGVAAALIMLGFAGLVVSRLPGRAQQGFDRDKFKSLAGATDQTRGTPEARAHGDDFFDDFFDDEDDDDDDAYVEFTLAREPLARQTAREPQPRKGFDGRNAAPRRFADDETAPLSSRVEHPRQAPARATRSDPAGASNSLFDEPGKPSNGKPINDVHNGFHVEKELDLRPKTQFAPLAADSAVAESEDQHRLSDEYDEAYGIDDGRQAEVDNGWNFAADGSHFGSSDDTGFEEVSFEDLWSGKSTRRPPSEGEPPRNRHRRSDSDDVGAHGRHSHPD